MPNEPRGQMFTIDSVINPYEGLPGHRGQDVHVTGRADPPPPDNKGVSIWPL